MRLEKEEGGGVIYNPIIFICPYFVQDMNLRSNNDACVSDIEIYK